MNIQKKFQMENGGTYTVDVVDYNANYTPVVSFENTIIYKKKTIYSNKVTVTGEEDITTKNEYTLVGDGEVTTKEVEWKTLLKTGYKVPYDSGKRKASYDDLRSAGDMFLQLLQETVGNERLENGMRYLMYKIYGVNKWKIDLDLIFIEGGDFSEYTGGLVSGNIQEKIWFAMKDMGFSEAAIAAAMGNFDYESGQRGIDPTAEEFPGQENKGGKGIAQWTAGRRVQLYNYANSKGVDWRDENLQITFLLAELTEGGGADGYANYQLGGKYNGYTVKDWTKANDRNDIDESTRAFCRVFERCSDSSFTGSIQKRINLALSYYDKYNGKERPAGGAESALGDGYDQIFTLGENKYKEYKQNRGTYRTHRWGHDISSKVGLNYPAIWLNGCGPTSVAIVMSGYGFNVNPANTADKMNATGAGNTSSGASLRKVVTSYGIAAHEDYNLSTEKLIAQLKTGRPVILSVNSNHNNLFTSSGHIITLLAINEQNQIYVSNPNTARAGGWIDAKIVYECSKYAVFLDE